MLSYFIIFVFIFLTLSTFLDFLICHDLNGKYPIWVHVQRIGTHLVSTFWEIMEPLEGGT